MMRSPFVQAIIERVALRQDMALVAILVLTMGMMILPVPTAMADVLIAANIGLAMILMMVAIHIRGPVEFSTLPSVILITTAFRLSLSITTSRMVLVQADAGDIIRTFGEFVIAGNVVVGLVVYLIITIVQFVVITKGSERVAEVAARFTLDALPGKQISIDTDLRNGDIDQKEARVRRGLLEKESQLYGAMDGAMKFVKGDAIASLVIIVVNLVGGIAIGCLQRGMPFSEAVRTYSLLAVGDGLIAQIPALLISLTAGVIVTRVTSDAGSNLGRDIMSQITGEPRTLQIAAVVLVALALVPGFPAPVFLTLAVTLGAAGWALARKAKESALRFSEATMNEKARSDAAVLTVHHGRGVGLGRAGLQSALDAMRAEVGSAMGISVPRLNIGSDADAVLQGWRLDIDGVPCGEGPEEESYAVIPAIRSALCRSLDQFVGIQETQALLTRIEPAYKNLLQEASKAASVTRLAEVLRRLLREQVSVSNMRSILEAVAEWGGLEPNTAILAEHVRVALKRQIGFSLAGAGKVIPAILIEEKLDEAFKALVMATPAGSQMVLGPDASERLIAVLRKLIASASAGSAKPMLLSSSDIRRHLRALLARHDLDLAVLTHAELLPDFRLDVLDTLRHNQVIPPPSLRAIREPPPLVAASAR